MARAGHASTLRAIMKCVYVCVCVLSPFWQGEGGAGGTGQASKQVQ